MSLMVCLTIDNATQYLTTIDNATQYLTTIDTQYLTTIDNATQYLTTIDHFLACSGGGAWLSKNSHLIFGCRVDLETSVRADVVNRLPPRYGSERRAPRPGSGMEGLRNEGSSRRTQGAPGNRTYSSTKDGGGRGTSSTASSPSDGGEQRTTTTAEPISADLEATEQVLHPILSFDAVLCLGPHP
jgi:hypothetical protein